MNARSFMITAAAVSAAATLQAPASAAALVQVTPTTSSFVGMFNGTINDTTSFASIAAGSSLFLTLSGSSTVALTAASLSATFNGTPLALTFAGNSFSGLFTPTAGNVNTLVLSGTNAGLGVFTGTLTVLSAAVPEASTWAMMTIGFGALGYSLRRRRTSYNLV